MRFLATLGLILLTSCGGGTSHWTYTYASDNVTIDASGENEKLDPFSYDSFSYEQGDARFPNRW